MKLVLKLKEKKLEIGLQGKGGGAAMKPAETGPEPKSGNTCPECGKGFPSEKSLYGHMRLHPERSYRGIKPPSSSAAVAKKSLLSPAAVSNSAERSGSNITTEKIFSARDAVESLLSLIKYQPLNGKMGGFRSSKTTRRLVLEDDEDEEDYYSGDGYDYEDKHRRNLNRLTGVEEEVLGEIKEESESETSIHTTKKRKLSELESQVVTGERRFECETCGKCFSSHQALGGHKTGHRKAKTPSSSPSVKKEPPAKNHVCKICLKGFPSGQALGGHQRLHYEGRAATAAQSNSGSSKEEEGEGGVQAVVLGFDLNELPPMEMEEEDVTLVLRLGA